MGVSRVKDESESLFGKYVVQKKGRVFGEKGCGLGHVIEYRFAKRLLNIRRLAQNA